MVKPIRPEEINVEDAFPDFVLEAFNNIITQHYRNGSSSFKDKEVVAEIIKMSEMKGNPVTKGEIYEQDWLSVEEVYAKFGWSINRDSPGWSERGDSTFKFKPNKKH